MTWRPDGDHPTSRHCSRRCASNPATRVRRRGTGAIRSPVSPRDQSSRSPAGARKAPAGEAYIVVVVVEVEVVVEVVVVIEVEVVVVVVVVAMVAVVVVVAGLQ